MFLHQKDCLKHLIIGIFMVSIGSLVNFIDPLSRIIDDQFAIKRGKFLYNVWEKPPVDVFLNVYLFNVTNAEAFLSGRDRKLKMKEIGPYVYQEFLEHKNVTFNENGTVSYLPIRHCIPVVGKSVGDPYKDIVITPNLLLLGASAVAADHSKFAAYGFKVLAESLDAKPILNLSVHSLLWGYEDKLISMASNFLPSVVTFEKFGLIDRMFDEGHNHVTMHLPKSIEILKEKKKSLNSNNNKASIKTRSTTSTTTTSTTTTVDSVMDVEYDEEYEAEIVKEDATKTVQELIKVTRNEIVQDQESSRNNETRRFSLDLWNGKTTLPNFDVIGPEGPQSCNKVQGTFDGTLFPKNVSKNEKFKIYRKAFCRLLPIYFSHSGKLFGLDAYWFELSENAFYDRPEDPDTKCFCASENKCLRKGLGNISPCYFNIPAAVSQPHFFNADPTLLNEVEGLKPDKDKHQTVIVIQPQLGIAMNVFLRIQLNLLNGDLRFYDKIKNFSNMTLPIVWVELALGSLTPEIEMILKIAFDIMPIVQVIIIVGMVLGGIAFIVSSFIPRISKHDKKKPFKGGAEIPVYLKPIELPLLYHHIQERPFDSHAR